MSAPPVAAWEAREGKVYTAFLSHYKGECASTARYLHDLLQKMLVCDNFLDSSSLSDLRTLFDVGLRTSDTLVLLLSRNVLTRPWCLLELWEASLAAIPVILVDVHAGFDPADARHLLMHLEVELEARNPGALAEVEGHLAAKGATVADLSAALLDVLRLPPCESTAAELSQISEIGEVTELSQLTEAELSQLTQIEITELSQLSHARELSVGARSADPRPPPPRPPPPQGLLEDGAPPASTSARAECSGGSAPKRRSLGSTESMRGGGTAYHSGRSRSGRSSSGRRELSAGAGILQWDPCSSDRLLLGATKDLAEHMAAVTGRTLVWHDPLCNDSTESWHARAAMVEASLTMRPPPLAALADKSTKSKAAAADGAATAATAATPPALGWWRRWMRRRAPGDGADGGSGGSADGGADLTMGSLSPYDGNAYGLFISYSRAEASAHARLLQALFERAMTRPVFLDATDAFDLDEILEEGVARSRALVLVQTRSTLRRPWCLLELNHAVTLRKPIVCIQIKGGGYDFGEAKAFLNNLESELEQSDPGALVELERRLSRRGESVRGLQSRLQRAIPNMISVPFDPEGTANHTTAVIQETLERIVKVSNLMLRRSTLFRDSSHPNALGGTDDGADAAAVADSAAKRRLSLSTVVSQWMWTQLSSLGFSSGSNPVRPSTMSQQAGSEVRISAVSRQDDADIEAPSAPNV